MKTLVVVSMTSEKKYALFEIRRQADPIVEHLLCIKTFSNNVAVSDWESAIANCLYQVKRSLKIKGNKTLKQSTVLEKLLQPVTDKEDLKVLLNGVALKMKVNPRSFRPDVTLKEVRTDVENLCRLIFTEDVITKDDVSKVLSKRK